MKKTKDNLGRVLNNSIKKAKMKTDINILNRDDYISKYWDIARVWRRSPEWLQLQLKKEAGLTWDKFN